MQTQYLNEININSKILDNIKNIVGNDFIYTKENREMLNKLFFFFLGNKEQCDKRGVSMNKSFAIFGEYGCGKTMLFKIIHEFLSSDLKTHCNNFKIISIEDIIKEASSDTFLDGPLVYNLTQNEHGILVRNPIHVLVNEFGSKYNVKLYGTDVNELIDMFWMKRYEIHTDYNKFTHITANTDINDIVTSNTSKLVDRFKEMFQIHVLSGKSFRK